MATIKEIAAIAGVSRGTVDRVLNNRGSVNPETEKKIKEIAERLNYQPNKAGLMLAAQKKNYRIGVILFSDSTLFFQEIMDGINAKAAEFSGYNVTIVTATCPFDEAEQLKAIDEIADQEINGLLIAPMNAPEIAQRINELESEGITVVTVNTDIESDRTAFVGCDFYKSGATAAGLVGHMTQGDVHVGIITGSSHILCHTDRIRGFTHRIEELYPNISVSYIAENHDDDVESYKLVTTILTAYPNINCLYFTAGGVSGGCKAIEDLGYENRLKVFAYDNISTTVEYVKKGLIDAIICQHQFDQGYQAFDLLARHLLENTPPEKENVYLDIDIRISESL